MTSRLVPYWLWFGLHGKPVLTTGVRRRLGNALDLLPGGAAKGARRVRVSSSISKVADCKLRARIAAPLAGRLRVIGQFELVNLELLTQLPRRQDSLSGLIPGRSENFCKFLIWRFAAGWTDRFSVIRSFDGFAAAENRAGRYHCNEQTSCYVGTCYQKAAGRIRTAGSRRLGVFAALAANRVAAGQPLRSFAT
jgi:hypothetical protein